MDWKIDIQNTPADECLKIVESPQFLDTLASLPKQKNKLVSIVKAICQNVGSDQVALTIWGSGFASDNGWFSASIQFKTQMIMRQDNVSVMSPSMSISSTGSRENITISDVSTGTPPIKFVKKVRDGSKH